MQSAFGMTKAADVKLPYLQDGVVVQKGLGKYLRDIFMYIAFKTSRYETCISPFIAFLYYTKRDRECLKNIEVCR
jgi:hypothetical protein